MVGVVGAGFDPNSGAEAAASPQGWVLFTLSGNLVHAGLDSRWEGQPTHYGATKLKQGDVVVRPPSPCHAAPYGSRCVRCRACCSTSTRPP